jgi:UDP-N-acetylglucosamine diphosphorylase/glucosamine-1-phosphate N-acetyltransferase
MNTIITDAGLYQAMKPLSWTRPVAELRTGILSTKQRWEYILNQSVSVKTESYLSDKYGMHVDKENLLIHAGLMPDDEILSEILSLKQGSIIYQGKTLAAICKESDFSEFLISPPSPVREYEKDCLVIEHPWDIFTHAGRMIQFDFNLLTINRNSATLSDTNTLLGNHPLFIEEGAKVEASVINTTNGPVYIGTDAEIMEGSQIRGPFAMLEHSAVKMGAKIYGPTVLGPHVKVGGELNNVVVFGYSNKAHDGFLGNAVIGEWCNLGADTNNSNLKNNYAEVKMWDYRKHGFIRTGLQFCGTIMGDHSKCGINTMLNTGTVIGVSCNIFGAGFPRNFIPSFSWGGSGGYTDYHLDKALSVTEIVMSRRDINLSEHDKAILKHVYESTQEYRRF